MQNKGFDFSVGHAGSWWNASFNGAHYNNKIVSIDGVQNFFFGPIGTRIGNSTINMVGQPIGSFYGYIADGFFRDAADVSAHATQDGAAPGRIKFRDVNGDGRLDLVVGVLGGAFNPVKTSAAAPRKRWRSSSHAGRVIRLAARVVRASPHSIEAASRSDARMPPDRAVYHQI